MLGFQGHLRLAMFWSMSHMAWHKSKAASSLENSSGGSLPPVQIATFKQLNMLGQAVHLKMMDADDWRYPQNRQHLCTGVICDSVSTALAYTSAGPLSLKQNGVFTHHTASGCTDPHTAHSTHAGAGGGFCSFLLIHELQLVRAGQLRKRACLDSGSGSKRRDLFATE